LIKDKDATDSCGMAKRENEVADRHALLALAGG
jgi:hypothetical protein